MVSSSYQQGGTNYRGELLINRHYFGGGYRTQVGSIVGLIGEIIIILYFDRQRVYVPIMLYLKQVQRNDDDLPINVCRTAE